jgi:hypothetical protein
MQLQEADLREFIEIWSNEFHETISAEDAKLSAAALLELYRLLASRRESKSIPLDNHEVFPLL